MNFSGSQPLARAPRLYVFSGAGLSAESGVPTFRSTDGIWSKFDLDEVCNFNLWRKHRSAVFRFYEDRRKEIEAAQPNGAHRLLALWQHTWGAERVRLITQNVDNLLERAAARDVVHLHGDLATLHCTDCGHKFPAPGATLDESVPCPACGRLEGVKPGIVMFFEPAPMYARLDEMEEEISGDDLFVVVGTAFEVLQPDRLLPADRFDRHPRNILVDPAPKRTEFFGVVEELGATAGLHRIAHIVSAVMNPSTVPEPA